MNKLGYQQITQEKAKRIIDNEEVIILDVREEFEYDESHIENSVLIPLGEITSRAEEVLTDKNAKILVYCRSGRRSKHASIILAMLGYKNIYEFGGILTWEYGVVE